jgi:hypothetical protein
VLLNTGTIKLASITQNNHVYEYTAESPTPEMLLNIRSPYRRQKRDLSIIRLSFRRSLYTGIEIPAINTITFLPTISTTSYFLPSYLLAITSTTSYFPTFLRYDHTDYLTFLTTTSTISYLPTFLRSHRLLPTFLPSCGHIDYLLPTYISLTSRRQSILAQPIKTALDLPCPGIINN